MKPVQSKRIGSVSTLDRERISPVDDAASSMNVQTRVLETMMIRAAYSKQTSLVTCAVFTLASILCQIAVAQQTAPSNWTAEQDHQNMMDQLGINALRAGPSGNEKDPNHANYDEAKANRYGDLPDALTMRSGQKVTSAQAVVDSEASGDR